jgi:Pyridoxamine 5'-phosphate oxidase
MPTPIADRPQLPAGYGIPQSTEGMLEWDAVVSRLEQARNFWIATATLDGHPVARPLWGVWMDNQIYFEGSPQTRWGRLVSINPYIQVHLESGNEVVIIEGTVIDELDVGADRYQRITDIYAAKYDGYRPQDHGFFVVTPNKVLAWASFPATLTRFRWKE